MSFVLSTGAAAVAPAGTGEASPLRAAGPAGDAPVGGPLAGHTAVVVGGAGGIGLAYARRLAADGASVAVLDTGACGGTARQFAASGRSVFVLPIDITDPGQLDTGAQKVEAELGPPDIVVNNASVHPIQFAAAVSLSDWRRMFEVNTDSMLVTCRAFAPGMQRQGWGRIVNMTSNTVGLGVPGYTRYLATRVRRHTAAFRLSAVSALTRRLAGELAPFGITVNALGPSLVRTSGAVAGPGAVLDVPPGREPAPGAQVYEDLLATLAFLVSDDAGLINGHTVCVDRGLLRAQPAGVLAAGAAGS
jgi:NAD(P)-dependent dehydrogenase (short-subunit alcohol dehydrogenase family)